MSISNTTNTPIGISVTASSPGTGDNIAAGYVLGQEWYNTTTGDKFYHKFDGVWVSTSKSLQDVIDVNKVADRVEFKHVPFNGSEFTGGYDYLIDFIESNQDDGVYIYGDFAQYGTSTGQDIVKINSDGTIDASFNVGTGFNNYPYTGSGKLAQTAAGKLYVSGSFTTYNGTTVNRIVRLNTNGTIDSSFVTGSGFYGGLNYTNSIGLDSSERVYVAGGCNNYNGTSIPIFARLLSNGTLDTSFVMGSGFDNTTTAILVNSDDTLFVGGHFTTYNGTSSPRFVKLLSNGGIDTSFVIGAGFNNIVTNIVKTLDDKIIVTGHFTTYQGVSANRIIKLNLDGSRDTSFDIGTGFSSTDSYSLKILLDGKLLIKNTGTYNGVTIAGMLILNTDGSIFLNAAHSYTGFTQLSDGRFIGMSNTGITNNQLVRIVNGLPIQDQKLTFSEVTGKAEYTIDTLDGTTTYELLPKHLIQTLISNATGTPSVSVVNTTSLFSTGLSNTGLGATVSYSIFLGTEAGLGATASSNSVFLGRESGYNGTSAHNSVFIGYQSGKGSAAAAYSNFIGMNSGTNATNAQNSNFFGPGSGQSATNAYHSNFIGQGAGSAATGAYNSNFLGETSGWVATGAYQSNFIGKSAGYGATTAYNSNFLGLNAGYQSTSANNSNFLGSNAGNVATNASKSNFIGAYAGFQASNADNSNFLGYNSGSQASSANNSNFIGAYAGNGASGAYRSNFLGYNSGYGATAAHNSNFLGFQSGNAAVNANNSNFLGSSAGSSATNAYDSNFLGYQAGYLSTSAYQSNFIGKNAGYSATTASNSNFLGFYSGYQAANANNSNFLGENSGYSATDAYQANFLGYNAGYNATTAYRSNFFGPEAGMNSTGNNVNAFGYQANKGGSLSGQTVFSNGSLPSYLDRSAATTAITVPNGAVAGNTYLYYNQTTFGIEAVRL